MSSVQALVAILGMTAITVITRGFFLLSEREWPLPAWVNRGLRYAPLAALAAVIAPEIVLRCKRVFRAVNLDLDSTDDRSSLCRHDVSLLEDFERLGLHRHDDKSPPKLGVNPKATRIIRRRR